MPRCSADVFTLDELNLDTAAAMTLLLAATGQTIVLLRGGIDLSIGGMISPRHRASPRRSSATTPVSAALWAVADRRDRPLASASSTAC